MIRWRITFLVLLSSSVFSANAHSALQVLSWNLGTHLSQHINDESIIDSDDILTLSNPLNQVSHAQVGTNFSEVEYDCAWLIDEAFGHFNMSITHAIRSPEVRTISTSSIFISVTEPVRVAVTGSIAYAHTPGDDDSLSFFASVRNIAANFDLFHQSEQGGNFYFLPSSGTLTIEGEAILSPGITYRLRYGLDITNISDLLPTGILDAAGHVNFTISPVPEPATLALLTPAFAAILSRRRRR